MTEEEVEKIIEVVAKFLYHDTKTELARPGMYSLKEDEFRHAFRQYLKTGKNILEELDKITWASWETEESSPWSYKRWDTKKIKFLRKILAGKGFWRVGGEVAKAIKNKAIEDEAFWEFRKTYQYKRKNGFTETVKKRAFKKYGRKCKKCGSKKDLEIDHIQPLIGGGTNQISNLQILCRICHRAKTTKEAKGQTWN